MSRARFVFEDLGPIEARIRRLSEDAAYLVLQDRSRPGKDLRVGRFDLTEQDARPWQVEDRAPDPDDREDLDGDPEDDLDDEDPDALEALEDGAEGDEDDLDAELSWPQIKDAACRWLRDTAQRHAAGEPPRRLRLKILGPKGASLIDSGHFTCRDRSYRKPVVTASTGEEVEPSALPGLPPMPPLPEPSVFAETGGDAALDALGRYYTQFGHIVLGTIGQLQGINNTMVSRLASDLDRSRTQVEELVASILEYRASQLEQEHAHQVQSGEVDARTTLARETIGHLGAAAQALFGAPNLPPQLMGLVSVIAQNPALIQTLTDPGVIALLSNPEHVSMLIGMLRHFAAQAQGAAPPLGGAPGPEPAPPTSPEGAPASQ